MYNKIGDDDMEWIERLNQSITYIENNLEGDK